MNKMNKIVKIMKVKIIENHKKEYDNDEYLLFIFFNFNILFNLQKLKTIK